MVSALILSLKKHKNIYGSKIKLLSPAKINLYLNIIGKYSNGFHRLVSIVERISLMDKISIEVKKTPAILIQSNIKALETSDNIVYKAISLLKKKYKISLGFKVKLRKNIPIGSGLGGGSSNAASVLLGVNKLLNLKLKKEELYKLGAKLGSDVNFFIADTQFALLQGRGEKVTLLKIRKKYKHKIIWPAISISTKKVYEKLRNRPRKTLPRGKQACLPDRQELTEVFNNVNMLQYALRWQDQMLIKKSIFNALEKSAFSVSKKLEKAKTFLEKKGVPVKLTGSGSALYTISAHSYNYKKAEFKNTSVREVKKMVPSSWAVFSVQTF